MWAAARPAVAVGGALLVAPPDVERADTPAALTPFAPMPHAALPFPSLLAASRDDPYLSWARAEAFATAWGRRCTIAAWPGT
jgi:predicted alpha/beta hydrolase family esterase